MSSFSGIGSTSSRRIGPFAIVSATVITFILLMFPRSKEITETHDHEGPVIPVRLETMDRFEPDLPPDWMHVWRAGILITNILSLLTALGIIYSNYIVRKTPRPRMSQLLSATKTFKTS